MISLAGAKTAADSMQRVLEWLRPDTAGFDRAPGVGDDQRLMVGTCPGDCRYGPRAQIQPYRGSNEPLAVRADSVLIIARIINNDSIGYGKFNLHARDTVYWGITTRGNRRLSIFYSSRAADRRPYYSDLVIDDYHLAYRQASARWYWDDRDEQAWGTCDGGRCCRSSGIRLER